MSVPFWTTIPIYALRYLFPLIILSLLTPAWPQVPTVITSDGSLGTMVSQNGTIYIITGGLRPDNGPNLFHSFDRFDIGTGDTARFVGPPAGIEHILSRVTGEAPSMIDGRLQSLSPNADLFFLNPNGVVFGPNARLDVRGSFYASTAHHLQFEDGTRFVMDREADSALSVAAPVSFGFLSPPAPIAVQGATLRAADGAALALIAGDIQIVGGSLETSFISTGRLHLASVASQGEVPLDLALPLASQYGAISLTDNATLRVRGEPTGDIVIRAGQLVLNNSSIIASGFSDLDGGQIDIWVADTLSLGQSSRIELNANFDGGVEVIRLQAQTLSVRDRSHIRTTAESIGDAGDIDIMVDRLTLDGESRIDSKTFDSGDAGQVNIIARDTLTATGTGNFRTAIATEAVLFSSGNAGSLNIQARTIQLDGAVFSTETLSRGKAGDLVVQAEQISLTGGALISSSTRAAGQAGMVSVQATASVSISGESSVSTSTIQTETSGAGNAGTVSVTTPSLQLDDGGDIKASTVGAGRAGDIQIDVGQLSISGNSQISNEALVGSLGEGGNVTITATESVSISNQSLNPFVRSGIASDTFGSSNAGTIRIATPLLSSDNGRIETQSFGRGRSGDIFIDTGQLILANGAQISADTISRGQGGSLTIHASESVLMTGRSASIAGLQSGISSSASGDGHAGSVFLSTPTLELHDGFIGALTSARGLGGEVQLNVGQLTLSQGSQINTLSLGAGRAGNVTITAATRINITGGPNADGVSARFISTAFDEGQAGDIMIKVPVLHMQNGARIEARTLADGDAGVVRIESDRLIVTGGSQVSTASGVVTEDGAMFVGRGEAGSVLISATDSMMVSGPNSSLQSSTLGDGQGGDIILQSPNIQVSDQALVSAQSVGTGDAGTIRIQGAGRLFLSAGSRLETKAMAADGGNIELMGQSLIQLQDSQIITEVESGIGAGGNITVDASLGLLERSEIRADAFGGPGGNITIQTDGFITDVNSVVSASSERSVDGTVEIQGLVDLSGSLTPIDQSFLSTAILLADPCVRRLQGEGIGHFLVAGRDRIPTKPGGLLPSPSGKAAVAAVTTPAHQETAVLNPRQPLRLVSTRAVWSRDCVR